MITDKKISLVQQELVPALELIAKTGRPLTIIAEDVEGEDDRFDEDAEYASSGKPVGFEIDKD